MVGEKNISMARFLNLLIVLGLLKDRQEITRTLYSLGRTYATVQIIAGIGYRNLAKNGHDHRDA